MSGALDRLCRAVGIAREYHDIWGALHRAPEASCRALLAAMGVDAADPERALRELDDEPWRDIAPTIAIQRADQRPYRVLLRLPVAHADREYRWELALEDGALIEGRFRPRELLRLAERTVDGVDRAEYAFDWHDALPLGYHVFRLYGPDAAAPVVAQYVITPARCYLPPALAAGEKVWGVTAQLYGVRSERNWGMGDFTDLRNLVALWVRRGAAVIGLNPLHALFPHQPAHVSPYSPSSRLFLNVLYVDVEALEEWRESVAAQQAMAEPQVREQLAAARSAEFVDYDTVAALKLRMLELAYTYFLDHHLAPATPRGVAFRLYLDERGEALRRHALYEALQEHFQRENPGTWGWPVWPEPYRDPDCAAVRDFAQQHTERVTFYAWLQWVADEQLAAAARCARELDAPIGLYVDLSISIDRSGAESWAHQAQYALGVSVGAPPDEINRAGQNWGLPPLLPAQLKRAAYAPFIATLRANMRHAGALRIDHVMGLARLFWIPELPPDVEGRPPKPGDVGAYVHYPFADLLGLVALESERNRCMVIGEDLGTVPDEIRAGLQGAGILSYRLLYFERDAKGDFLPPADYPENALVAATTHDLPTLAGYWHARDIELRQALGVYPDDAVREEHLMQRALDRAKLIVALEREGLAASGEFNPLAMPTLTPELARRLHVYLARTPARALAVQLEDVFGATEAANLPGTTTEHPNWRRRLDVDLERFREDARLEAMARALATVRPRIHRRASPQTEDVRPIIPRATYRLQLHAGFTFRDATAIVPYLADLGVSHIYCSPYLEARPGSTHGYDIIDHNGFNPEIGTRADFERFVRELRAHGMGHILDMVPNHMGVMQADNHWWLDVLENGPAAAHARYFDIEWRPAGSDYTDRVLLPVLGDHYGTVLERGEVSLAFHPDEGTFSAHYYAHRFPLDPCCYADILDRAAASLAVTDAAGSAELAGLATAFRNLPGRNETATERVLERRRDKELHKQRLVRLLGRSGTARAAIDHALQTYHGEPGVRGSYVALERLLDRQAYRLAYWRAAADEINYRRFFDINDLAALRMEEPGVFQATHRMALSLAAEGRVDALRIDHPDGLFDPAAYFRQLQERYASLTGAVLPAAADGHPPRVLYVVAEKIAAPHERLPGDWAVHGTTGYRFANVVNGLFVDTTAAEEFDRIFATHAPEIGRYEDVVYESKRIIMRGALASPLAMLATELLRIARMDSRTRDFTLNGLREALLEIVACFPVYRTYIAATVSEQDRRYVEWAVAQAKRRARLGDTSVFDFVRSILLAQAPDDAEPVLHERIRSFAMKVQQFTSPVAAKGVEDTAFYRYSRLASLCEVGGEPRDFGMTVNAFHGASADRAQHWPHTMLATSTHDNKRSENVRTRIDVLSELTAEWRLMLRRWSRMNRNRKREVDGEPVPTGNEEYLLYQVLLGSLPHGALDEEGLADYRNRIKAYMLKAVREAKLRSSWINVDADYENALTDFIDQLLAGGQGDLFLDDLRRQVRVIAWFGALNSLSMTTLKFASPGVPDIYQGTELIDLSLVDPDNRRPVDYARRAHLLDSFRTLAAKDDPAGAVRELARAPEDGRAKLWVASRALALRREQPGLFERGSYVPLTVQGRRADHVVAFARVHEREAVIAIAGRLWAKLGATAGTLPLGAAHWDDTAIDLAPLAGWVSAVNVYTGRTLPLANGTLRLADLFAEFPAALLKATRDT